MKTLLEVIFSPHLYKTEIRVEISRNCYNQKFESSLTLRATTRVSNDKVKIKEWEKKNCIVFWK